ncbi:hypothetical protein KAX75_02655 [candidate division WOR-3 bacterium]|nr:hypothetical protein [candidate division WOR-3 bacterium]
MYNILLRQIEAICQEEGNYITQLRNEIANKERYLKDIQLIKLFENKFRIPDDILNFLIKHGTQLFFEFPLKEEKDHITFFNKVYKIKKSESPISQEFDTYRNLLAHTYRNVLRNEPEAAVVFEIGYLNKAGDYIENFQKNEFVDTLAHEILFMKNIIDFLSNIRKELSKTYPIPISFFERFLDKFPYASILEHPMDDYSPLFLSRGFPLPLFNAVHNLFIQFISHNQISDIINVIRNKTLITNEDIRKCNFSKFIFPQNKEINILLKIFKNQAEKSEIKLVKEDREFSLMDYRVSEQTKRIVKEKGQSISNAIDDKNKKSLMESSYRISRILSEVEKTCLDYIWHLKDFFNKSYNLSQKIESNLSLKNITFEQLKSIFEKEIYHNKDEIIRRGLEFLKIKPFLDIIQPNIGRMVVQRTLDLYYSAEKGEIKNGEKIKEILLNLREKGKRKYQPDANKIIQRYKNAANEILLPLLICGLLQKNIKEWPKVDKIHKLSQARICNEVNYFGFYGIPKGKFFHFSKSGKIKTYESSIDSETIDNLIPICLKHFKKVITVLIYDIRGSSFMTLKLHNAEREQMIIKNFHSTMANIAKEYGAFLLKDIGDGGIIWFGKNSKELYNSIYRESTTKKFKKLRHSLLSEEGLFLQSSPNSSEKAILCAISMIKAAEKFIKDNYIKYRDWFSDIKEKELIVEGTTYTLLPPMFRSLFRLGIGISSGIPSRDVSIGPNAFGDPDLRGVLVNEAMFLSEGRDPEKSVILVDHDTIMNLLLNTSNFTFGNTDSNLTNKEEMMSRAAEIVKDKLKGGILNFTGKNFIAEPYEILSLTTFKREKYSPLTIKINEDGIFYNEHGEKIKILYLIRA